MMGVTEVAINQTDERLVPNLASVEPCWFLSSFFFSRRADVKNEWITLLKEKEVLLPCLTTELAPSQNFSIA